MGIFDGIGADLQGIGAVFNPISSMLTNQSQQQAASNAQNFSMAMSDTAHQREVADLKAAGLNPILSAQTSGSSTPTGQMPTLQAPQITMPDFMGYGVSLKQLENQSRDLDIKQQMADTQQKKTDSDVITNTSQQTLNALDAKLKKQGWLGRTAGTGVGDDLSSILKTIRDSVLKIQSPSLNSPNNNPGYPVIP